MACGQGIQQTDYKGVSLPDMQKLTNTEKDSVMMAVINMLMQSELPNMCIEIACGIAGNIKAESDFNYTAIGDHGTSYGLCQWHEGRIKKLYAFCKENNLSYTSPSGQTKYLIHELMTDEARAYKNISKSDVRKDIDKVATNFCLYFERPKNKETNCPKRASEARTVYNKYKSLKTQP